MDIFGIPDPDPHNNRCGSATLLFTPFCGRGVLLCPSLSISLHFNFEHFHKFIDGLIRICMNPYQDNTLLYGTKYAITRDNQLVILSADKTDQKRYR